MDDRRWTSLWFVFTFPFYEVLCCWMSNISVTLTFWVPLQSQDLPSGHSTRGAGGKAPTITHVFPGTCPCGPSCWRPTPNWCCPNSFHTSFSSSCYFWKAKKETRGVKESVRSWATVFWRFCLPKKYFSLFWVWWEWEYAFPLIFKPKLDPYVFWFMSASLIFLLQQNTWCPRNLFYTCPSLQIEEKRWGIEEILMTMKSWGPFGIVTTSWNGHLRFSQKTILSRAKCLWVPFCLEEAAIYPSTLSTPKVRGQTFGAWR